MKTTITMIIKKQSIKFKLKLGNKDTIIQNVITITYYDAK